MSVPAEPQPTRTPPAIAAGRVPASRLLAFSDAVLAIAMTLLVLPLLDLVQEGVREESDPASIFTDNLASLGSFFLSFAVIWRIWTVHHRLFAEVELLSTRVVLVNMLWLMCLVFLPVPVALVGSFGAEPFVLGLYVFVLLCSNTTLAVMAFLLRRDDSTRRASRLGGVQEIFGNAACLVVAFIIVVTVPAAGFWPLLLLLVDGPVTSVLRRLPARVRVSRE